MIMKSIILAGGTGTRLGSLTYVINKHLLPVGDKPMLAHGLDFAKQIGVDELLIITTNTAIEQLSTLIGHYPEWDRRVQFAIQSKPLGIADAIRYGEIFCDNEPFMVLLGDNIIAKENIPYMRGALTNNNGQAHIWAVELPDVRHCGVLTVDGQNRIIDIAEKPQNPRSNLAIVGCYVFDNTIWEMLPKLKLSGRNEYEIIDILRTYHQSQRLTWHKYDGHWMDLGSSLRSYYTESLRLV